MLVLNGEYLLAVTCTLEYLPVSAVIDACSDTQNLNTVTYITRFFFSTGY